jgi:hypothetical protein
MSLAEYVKKEDLVQLFHLPMKAAASKLGVSESSLRNISRKHNVDRWPYRKFQQLDAHIESLRSVDGKIQNNEDTERTNEMIQNLLRARKILENAPNMSLELAIVHANKQQGDTSNLSGSAPIPTPITIPQHRQHIVQSNPISIPHNANSDSPYSPVMQFSPNGSGNYSPQYRISTNIVHHSNSPTSNGQQSPTMFNYQQQIQWQQQQQIPQQQPVTHFGTLPNNVWTRKVKNSELQTRNRSNSSPSLPQAQQQQPPLLQQLHHRPVGYNSNPTTPTANQWYPSHASPLQEVSQMNWSNRLQEMRTANTPPPVPTQSWSPSWESQNFGSVQPSSPVPQTSSHIQSFAPTANQQPFLRFNDRSFLQELNSRDLSREIIFPQNNSSMIIDDYYFDNGRLQVFNQQNHSGTNFF